ncbi:MAG: hypothetical protein ABIR71_00420, partial [Chthoniobacterales bacterium]
MQNKNLSRSGSLRNRASYGALLGVIGLGLGLIAVFGDRSLVAQDPSIKELSGGMTFGESYKNDISPPMSSLPPQRVANESKAEEEANENPKIPNRHQDSPDPVVQNRHVRGSSTLNVLSPNAPNVPAAIMNFDGIAFPGVGCNCAPPDTNGAIGRTQYVQIVNEGYQVFDKTTGASVLPATAISAIWSGFGGACETLGSGDPVVLYDHLADRWLVS